LLEVNDLNVFYKNVQALWGVSINVNEGEFISIVGSNGAGKTTLLRTIAGLHHPASGEIKFMGQRIDKIPPHRIAGLGISYVQEGRKTFPELTVYENLKVGAYLPEMWKKQAENMEFAFDLFPILKERKGQLAGTLSGGERQMLAIGQGLMAKPKLLILDEPSLGLAPKVVQNIFGAISKINEEGVTILLVEQNVHQALELASRAYVLERGGIVLAGGAKEILDNPNVKKVYLGM
jgi:branched-chain amino acid transport system ATP-binding protein